MRKDLNMIFCFHPDRTTKSLSRREIRPSSVISFFFFRAILVCSSGQDFHLSRIVAISLWVYHSSPDTPSALQGGDRYPSRHTSSKHQSILFLSSVFLKQSHCYRIPSQNNSSVQTSIIKWSACFIRFVPSEWSDFSA